MRKNEWWSPICIAYGIIAHKGPDQVRRLLKRIDDPSDNYYISLFNKENNGGAELWRRKLDGATENGVEIVDGYSNGWGSFNMVKATLDAMAFYHHFDYDYFINLSGQCYPLTTVSRIKERLRSQNGTGFIECNPLPWGRWVDENGGFDRVYRAWYKPFKSMNKMSLPRLKKELPDGMVPYGGSQWFCLPKEQVEYVLDICINKPHLERFFERTLIPDELFFQTILMNSPYKDKLRTDDNLRFIDWAKKCVPLPAYLLAEDFIRLTSSGKLFARKFDTILDDKILNLLDDYLLGMGDVQTHALSTPTSDVVPLMSESRERSSSPMCEKISLKR